MDALPHHLDPTPIRLRSRRHARAFTAGLVLILSVCLGFLGGVGYALLAIGATR